MPPPPNNFIKQLTIGKECSMPTHGLIACHRTTIAISASKTLITIYLETDSR